MSFTEEYFKIGYQLQKNAGVGSEVAGSFMNPINVPFTIPAAMIGALVGEKDQRDIGNTDADTWKNLLIPGLGAYRLGKRMHANTNAYNDLSSDEMARLGVLKAKMQG